MAGVHVTWHCANDCGRTHPRDTVEPELCEVCRLEAERDEAIARGVRLWEWAAHDALIRCAFNMAVLPDTLWNEETRAFVEAVETAKDEGL